MTAATVPTLTDDEIHVIWEGVPDCSMIATYEDQRRFARAVLEAVQPVLIAAEPVAWTRKSELEKVKAISPGFARCIWGERIDTFIENGEPADVPLYTHPATAQPLPAQAITNQPAVTDKEVHSFMSQLTIPGEYFSKMAPAYKSALKAFAQSRAIAQPVCIHDETERLGAIWTRCTQCGKKWADDEISTEDAKNKMLRAAVDAMPLAQSVQPASQAKVERLREALKSVQYKAVSLADCQVIALEALTTP